MMRTASAFGGAIATQPVGDLKVKVRYRFRDKTFEVGTIDLRRCIQGPSG